MAISQLKASLTDFSFRVYNGVPQFSVDGGTTWQKMGGNNMELDYANAVEHSYASTQTDTTFTASVDGVLFYSFLAPKLLQIAGKKIILSYYGGVGTSGTLVTGDAPISAGDVVVFSAWGDGVQGSLLTEVPYKS